MVFFTCNICGESIKKPAVEKHYQQRCRGKNKNVSCMDCLKDFYGEEYVAHTKCISEAQKYSGKDYVHKESKNSNAKKQESWMDIIRSILESSEYNLTPPLRDAFQRLEPLDNVPRKKAKFQNFVSNCIRMNKHQAEQVWNILEKELNKMKEAKQVALATAKASNQTQNGTTNNKDAGGAPPAKKAKLEETPSTEESSAKNKTANEFDWHSQLAKIAAKQPDGIFVEKLKKKILKKYTKHLATDELSEKQSTKFEKRFAKQLKNCEALTVDGDLVKQT